MRYTKNNVLLMILCATTIVCILVSLFSHYRAIHFSNTSEPKATTDTEMISEKVFEIIGKNQEDQAGYNEFLADLAKEKIASPKIDMKFYLSASKAYRNRLLTRAYIVNRLSI